ncbi:MAG: hypothetical protein DRJ52_05660, partial [Thermoprotei archaeon]
DKKILEELRNVPLLQPFDPEATAEALSIFIEMYCNTGNGTGLVRGTGRAVLFVLYLKPMKARDIARELKLSPSTVYRVLRKLVGEGLVVKRGEFYYCNIGNTHQNTHRRVLQRAIRLAQLILLSPRVLKNYGLSPRTISLLRGSLEESVRKYCNTGDGDRFGEYSTYCCYVRAARRMRLEPVKYEEWLLAKTVQELAPRVRELLKKREKIGERFRVLLRASTAPSVRLSLRRP